jgi:alpha-1,2-mannosyltransferase
VLITDIFKIRITKPVRIMWIWSLPCSLLLELVWVAPAAKNGSLICSDFVNFWVGAKLAIESKVSHLYSIPGFRSEVVQHTFTADGIARIFSYPPNILVLIFFLGLLPYIPALALWSLAGTGCLVAVLRANRFCKLDAPTLALAAFSPAALFSLFCGQTGAFTATFFLGGFYLCESAPVAAGILFGLLTVKPHLGILIPFVLLLRRNWKCIASASITATVLAAVAFLLWGVAPWREYTAVILPYQAALLDRTAHNEYGVLMPGAYVDASMVLGMKNPWLIYGVAAIFALFVSFACVKREGVTARSVLVLSIATLIVTPYGFNYDMVAIMGALTVYLATLAEITVPVHLVFGLLWALPTVSFMLKRVPLPLSSAIMLGALACLHLDSRRDHSQSRLLFLPRYWRGR